MFRSLPLTMFSITVIQDLPESHKGAAVGAEEDFGEPFIPQYFYDVLTKNRRFEGVKVTRCIHNQT